MAMMEMGAKANHRRDPLPFDHHHHHHHVRNLWPSIGGGLPGGKPVEPSISAASFSPVLQKPLDYYGQSTSCPPDTPVVPANVNNHNNNGRNSYEYKSSQVPSDPAAAAAVNNAIATTSEYVNNVDYSTKNQLHPPVIPSDTGRWYPLPTSPSPLLSQQSFQTSRYYHPDPTTMVNQVSKTSLTSSDIAEAVIRDNMKINPLLFAGNVPVSAAQVGFIRTDTVLPFSSRARKDNAAQSPSDRRSDRLH